MQRHDSCWMAKDINIFFGKSVSRFVCRLKGTLLHTSVFWINLILVLIFCPLNHAFIWSPIFKRNIWPLGVRKTIWSGDFFAWWCNAELQDLTSKQNSIFMKCSWIYSLIEHYKWVLAGSLIMNPAVHECNNLLIGKHRVLFIQKHFTSNGKEWCVYFLGRWRYSTN